MHLGDRLMKFVERARQKTLGGDCDRFSLARLDLDFESFAT